MKQKMMGWQWHQLDHMQITCPSLQTDNHASTSSLNFYTPDAFADAQPTTLKHGPHLATRRIMHTVEMQTYAKCKC